MRIYATLLALFLAFTAQAGNVITATIAVTNAAGTTNHNTITVNGDVRTWTNAITTPATEILLGTNPVLAASALLNHAAVYPFTNLYLGQTYTTNITLRSREGGALAVTLSAGWGTVTLVTNTVGSTVTFGTTNIIFPNSVTFSNMPRLGPTSAVGMVLTATDTNGNSAWAAGGTVTTSQLNATNDILLTAIATLGTNATNHAQSYANVGSNAVHTALNSTNGILVTAIAGKQASNTNLTALADLGFQAGDIVYWSNGVLCRLPAGTDGKAVKYLGGYPVVADDQTGAPGGGITTLNTLTETTQTFATGTTGTDFVISSSTSTHTFNLPIASGSVTGKLAATDWAIFNGKANTNNVETIATNITVYHVNWTGTYNGATIPDLRETNIVITPTNLVNFKDFRILFGTNGNYDVTVSNAAVNKIRWNMNCTTNGNTSFRKTNDIAAELYLTPTEDGITAVFSYYK